MHHISDPLLSAVGLVQMQRSSLALVAAVICIIAGAEAGAAGAKSSCRTVVVHGTDANANTRKPASITVHRCDRIRVEFVFLTQEQLIYLWQVTHKPSKKVLKLSSHGYGKSTSETSTQIWNYRPVGKGKTYVKFGDFTPSYPNQPSASTFKLSVRVR